MNDLRQYIDTVKMLTEGGANEPSFRDLMKHHDADQPVRVGHLYHATPEDRLPTIMQSGLEPRAENLQDKFPPRIYLTRSEDTAVQLSFQLRKALVYRKGQKKSWRTGYAILKIDPLPDHMFYVDGYSTGGVYTDEPIPASAISLVGIIDGEALLAKNWPQFWKWYFRGEGIERPMTVPRWPANHRWRP